MPALVVRWWRRWWHGKRRRVLTAAERQMEAAINVLTSHASQLLDIPVLDSLFFGQHGRNHVMANICGEILCDTPAESEATRKKGRKKRAPVFDVFFPEGAFKPCKEQYTTKLPRIPPPWLLQLLQVLKENAAADEIFRKTGAAKRLRELMHALNKGEPMDFRERLQRGECTVHDLVSLLKAYIVHFEDPLIPHYQNNAFRQTAGISDPARRIEALQVLTLLCPSTHRLILQRLFECLQAVCSNAEKNRMNLSNLAVCIAPSIIRQSRMRQQALSPKQQIREADREKAVIEFMMQHGNEIFQLPAWLHPEMEKVKLQLRQEELEATGTEDPDLAVPALQPPPTVSRFARSDGAIVTDVTQREYMQAVKDHTEKELAKLYAFVSAEAENAPPAQTLRDGRRAQQHCKKIKKRMETMQLPGTPAAGLAARPKKTPLATLQQLGSRAKGLVTPKLHYGSARLVTPDGSPPKEWRRNCMLPSRRPTTLDLLEDPAEYADDETAAPAVAAAAAAPPTVADLANLLPPDEENDPPIWKGFFFMDPDDSGSHRETIV